MHPFKHAHKEHAEKRLHRLTGGKTDKAQDERLIKTAMSEHDKQQHGGKRTKLKFANGGHVPGFMAKPRMDKPSRHKGKKGGNTVNVIVAGHGAGAPAAAPMMPPVPAGAAMAPMARPPIPPMAGPGSSMLPPPGLPMRKRGGAVKRASGGKVKYTGGAADGVGRLEKVENYGKKARQIAPQNR